MATETENRARDQARAQVESIMAMVARCRDAQAIVDGLGYGGSEAADYDRETYHDEDSARETMGENALSVEIRSGWTTIGANMEAEDYKVLLCTGGPAVRITGSLGRFGEPDDARVEYQDWGTGWETYRMSDQEREAVMYYLASMYWGS